MLYRTVEQQANTYTRLPAGPCTHTHTRAHAHIHRDSTHTHTGAHAETKFHAESVSAFLCLLLPLLWLVVGCSVVSVRKTSAVRRGVALKRYKYVMNGMLIVCSDINKRIPQNLLPFRLILKGLFSISQK